MRLKYKWIFTLMLALIMQASFAQEKTITGVVTDASGPVVGANVVIKNTAKGVTTDLDGKYSIKANVGDALVFSFVDSEVQTIKVGSSNSINVKLKNGIELKEVVLVGQGIKKEKKAVGYAVTTIKSEEFADKPSTDVARALTGKAPGVNIGQTSGLSGSGTNIIIRGYTSITGNNQPLFIVDGIPFNTDTNSDGDFLMGATNASSRFLDLDPNSIESISILKGLSATTLYGSAGRNGVILVTTKSGGNKSANKKMEVNLSQSVYFTNIGSLPEYQNNYGNGFDNKFTTAFSNWGPHFGVTNTQGIDANGNVPHPYAYYGSLVFPQYVGQTVKYEPQNNVKPFFTTGLVTTTSMNLAGGNAANSYYINVGNTNDNGFIANNNYKRLTLSSGGTAKLLNGLTLVSKMNYVQTDKTAPPTAAGFGSNSVLPSVFANILYTPRSFDLFGVPYENPNDHSSVNYRSDIPNPRWTLKNASDDESVRRFYGTMSALYDLNSWSNISYRLSMDNYADMKSNYINRGNGQPFANDGYLIKSVTNSLIFDHTLSYNFNSKIDKKENWNLDGTLGFNPRLQSSTYHYTENTNQFLYGLMEDQNFVYHDTYSQHSSYNIIGLYLSSTLAFKDYLYVNLQGRNDWFSSLRSANRSLFYPSASVSFLPTAAIKGLKGNKQINYMKLRMGYGSSAGFPDPYKTKIGIYSATNRFLDQNGNVINVTAPSKELENPNLKPELIRELEFGFEGKFFQNRLGVDLSLYNKVSTNLIINRPLDSSSGYDFTAGNVAKMTNKGIELGLNFGIIRNPNKGFNWNLTTNFSQNRNKVNSLGLGEAKSLAVAGFTNLGNFAVEGEPYGVIMGSSIKTDVNGNYMVDSSGNYVPNTNLTIIGNPNAKWKSTIINEFSYKNVTFQFQVEYIKGGDIYSTTAAALLSRGLTKDTDYDRSGTVVLPGVNPYGNVNTTQIGYTQYGFNNSGFYINKQAIYDATSLRLREISLSYSMPKKFIEKTPFGKITFSVVGQNLWFRAINFPKYLHFDPEVSSLGVGNGQGFDYLTGPTAKRFGFSINLSF